MHSVPRRTHRPTGPGRPRPGWLPGGRPGWWPAGAALALALLAGCSGHTPSAGPASGSKPSASASAPGVRYGSLPQPCQSLSRATVTSLVPGSKHPEGSAAGSGQPDLRGGCSWTGLDGYQYRYLDAAFQRFEPITGAPTADQQAVQALGLAVQSTTASARSAKGKPQSTTLSGLGDQATLITWDVPAKGTTYHTATVVLRSGNAVITVEYVGAGLESAKQPPADTINAGAERAAREALGSLR